MNTIDDGVTRIAPKKRDKAEMLEQNKASENVVQTTSQTTGSSSGITTTIGSGANYPTGGTVTTGTANGGFYVQCANCGQSYLSGNTHFCGGMPLNPYGGQFAPTPPNILQQQQYPIPLEEAEKAPKERLEDLRKDLAKNIGALEIFLGFVEEEDRVGQLDEASYFIREALKIIRRVEKDWEK